MDYRQLDDQTLLRLIAHAHEDALSELYDRYNRLVYSMAINAVGETSLAEEITQDVFVRIWSNAKTYNVQKGKVITWIASIARYRAIDAIRRQNVRPEGHSVEWDFEHSPDIPNHMNVEEQVEITQRQQRVRHAMAKLPEEQLQALAYAYFQGYSHREIAEILSEPLGTVKTRIRLAMQKLRQYLDEENISNA
ncbi:MAG: sigma-70 family RNA polymerase sigma factor [Anaerolineales bacterium]|nr:sigma-70 family RNA polymerase sigma factor [Anaerolineales bacterium]